MNEKLSTPGFLELVRLGIKDPQDPLIVDSLVLVDQMIRSRRPSGEAWYRYNHDAYGETPMAANTMARNGVGRLWTLLTGERGEYEIAAGDLASARKRLDTMAGFANDGLMIPEQVWDLKTGPIAFGCGHRFGDATGVVHGAVHSARDQYREGKKRGDAESCVGAVRWLSQGQRRKGD